MIEVFLMVLELGILAYEGNVKTNVMFTGKIGFILNSCEILYFNKLFDIL
jgi:hypothetical protein